MIAATIPANNPTRNPLPRLPRISSRERPSACGAGDAFQHNDGHENVEPERENNSRHDQQEEPQQDDNPGQDLRADQSGESRSRSLVAFSGRQFLAKVCGRNVVRQRRAAQRQEDDSEHE